MNYDTYLYRLTMLFPSLVRVALLNLLFIPLTVFFYQMMTTAKFGELKALVRVSISPRGCQVSYKSGSFQAAFYFTGIARRDVLLAKNF